MYNPSTDHHSSFSSSLLDQIYRSIDEQRDHPKPIVYTKTKIITRSPDTESIHGVVSRPKPIRTSFNGYDDYSRKEKQINMYNRMYRFEELQLKHKHEGELVKKNTKSRAMKLYADLKKVKQPISPGGRLATFLNSLFTAKNTKRSAFSGSYDNRNATDKRSKSVSGSTCSSSGRKLDYNMKRSVSMIVGNDCKPRGCRSMYGEELNLHALKFVKKPSNDEFRVYSSEKISRTEEDPWSFMKNYQKKIECEFNFINGNNEIDLKYEVDDDNEDDDAASHTSSDLFELENFSAIEMEKYGDELPVFETTHLNKKLAIGNGFFM